MAWHWSGDIYFADDIFFCIFLNENVWIPINISLKFVPKCPINNIPALVQIMAWRRPGDKPLSEPMMVILKTHICVTRPQWVNMKPDQTGDWLSTFTEMDMSQFWWHFLFWNLKFEIFVTDYTGSCHFDNFQCSQWWIFHQKFYISTSVLWHHDMEIFLHYWPIVSRNHQ